MDELPRVTLVTPSLNQGEFIAHTIESVLAQNYPNLDYVIMDGGSTDDTLSIIRRYESDSRLTWYSELDNGQAHAINKAFRHTSGVILGWLNSDDVFIGQPVRESVVYFENHPEAMVVYGQVIEIDSTGKRFDDRIFGDTFDPVRALSDVRTPIPQPGSFFRRSLWNQTGNLREDLRYSLDTDFWIRASRHGQLHFMPGIRAGFRRHEQAKTVSGVLQTWLEDKKLAEWIFQQPDTYPDLTAKRRLIESNLAWGMSLQHGDTDKARRYAWEAFVKSPLRLRQVAMLVRLLDLQFGTRFSKRLGGLWRSVKRFS